MVQAEKALRAGASLNTKLLPYEFPSEGELHQLHDGWPYSRLDGCAIVVSVFYRAPSCSPSSVCASCEYGDSPLHVAARAGGREVLILFMRWGASPLATNDKQEEVTG